MLHKLSRMHEEVALLKINLPAGCEESSNITMVLAVVWRSAYEISAGYAPKELLLNFELLNFFFFFVKEQFFLDDYLQHFECINNSN